MKERPILFSAPMVRALLEGRKTQTRRVVKPRMLGRWGAGVTLQDPENFTIHGRFEKFGDKYVRCPYGKPGDRLWVRETWTHTGTGVWKVADALQASDGKLLYAATDEAPCGGCWFPSIHMYRVFSRITLEIAEVRVQRLQEISEEDAIAEGVESPDAERYEHDFSICPRCAGTRLYTAFSGNGGALPDTDCELCDTHVKRYQHLWESINGPGSWAANPWVWAVSF